MTDYKTHFCFSNFLHTCISYRVNEMINSTLTAHPQTSMMYFVLKHMWWAVSNHTLIELSREGEACGRQDMKTRWITLGA